MFNSFKDEMHVSCGLMERRVAKRMPDELHISSRYIFNFNRAAHATLNIDLLLYCILVYRHKYNPYQLINCFILRASILMSHSSKAPL